MDGLYQSWVCSFSSSERHSVLPVIGNLHTVEPRLSGFLDYPDFLSRFCHECLLVMIKIRSNILFKTIGLKSAVKSEFALLLTSKSSARTRRN